ncbi:MAG: sugar transferase [bacterium]|nr:sugar transferase [bacterium]
MLREKRSVLQISMLISDLMITIASFFIAYWLRLSIPLPWFKEGGIYPLVPTLKALLLLLPLWWLLYSRLGRYQPVKILGRYTLPLLPAYKANLVGLFVAITIAYFLKIMSVSRALVLIFFTVNCLLLTIWRMVLLFSYRLFYQEKDYRHVVIIGSGADIPNYRGFSGKNDEWGITVVQELARCPAEHLAQILRGSVVDDVIFVTNYSRLGEIEEHISLCEQMGVGVHIMTDWLKNRASIARIEDCCGIPMVTFDIVRRKALDHVIKRIIDFTVAATVFTITLPLMAVIALAIKLSSKGPVLFSQTRSGLNGRVFKLYKFRSMIQGAEKLQDELREKNEMSGPVFKIKDDPRLTLIGKLLRKTSLDELPQLFNVIIGDISLVGPRPLPVGEANNLQLWQRRRLSVIPGITCLWQINGRNEIDFDQWMELDMQYIDRWSLWLDIKIMLLTIPVVLMQKGAQ